MPNITVDGKNIACQDKQTILQACIDAGIMVPHYCYHPGLSIPASCRICLVEVEGLPKLVPSCQTPIRDGMVVHTQSSKAIANQKAVMEFLLINHPLDCPVCDQAGECYLQDYSYEYGRTVSRFEEDKAKKPKKDVGEHILLYSDRCIMCTRCVRFCREVTGTGELYVNGRGHKEEIDVFPGKPVNNKLAGNVVDICPVGALLDKDFLFKQRVWLLKSAASISPVDSGGENIWIDHNENVIYRVKPRYNANINQWWISDDTRYAWKVLYAENRLKEARKTQFGTQVPVSYDKALEQAYVDLKNLVAQNGPGSLYAMLSPMMACEEAWLLGQLIRQIDPEAVLVIGPIPREKQDLIFHNPTTGKETFTIKAEKVPNSSGIRTILEMLKGTLVTYEEFVAAESSQLKKLKGGWIVGGYLKDWLPKDQPALFKRGYRVVQDILPNSLTNSADIVLPAAAWAEKDGSWENYRGVLQPFVAAVTPPAGVMREGDAYMRLLNWQGMYAAPAIRKRMGAHFASLALPAEKHAVTEPVFEFAEL